MIFYPDNLFRLLWDLILLICLIINVVYIPLRISFRSSMDNIDNDLINNLFDKIPYYIFIGNIIIQLNSAYYYKGTLET